jgi:hypothetical protein
MPVRASLQPSSAACVLGAVPGGRARKAVAVPCSGARAYGLQTRSGGPAGAGLDPQLYQVDLGSGRDTR